MTDDTEWEFTMEDEREPQEELMIELARLLTALELSLDEENYIKCSSIQSKILIIEDKLKKYKK